MDLGADTNAQWRSLVVCTVLLYVKFLVTTMIQGRRGFQAGTRLPEDAALPMASNMAPATLPFQTQAIDEGQRHLLECDLRWKRIVQNDLESLPLAFAVFTISVLAGGHASVNRIALLAYTTARVCHTAFFAYKKAVPRMVAWIVGVLCILTAGINGVYAAVTLE
jgi:glutathione S-transferase